MPIDDHRWFNTLRAIQGSITSEEAGAIIDVARLAATADGTTSIDELAVIVMLRRMITEMAGGRMPDPSGAIDAVRFRDRVQRLFGSMLASGGGSAPAKV